MSEEWTFAEWMQRLRQGEPAASRQVFERYVHRLIGLARHRLSERARLKAGDEDVVQSALQSFFLHHVEEVDLTGEDSLWHKLLEITLRHCGKWNKRFRAQKRARPEVPLHGARDETASVFEPAGDEPSPEEAVLLADLVEHLMQELTDRQRLVVQLRLQGLSVADVSARLQVGEAMVYRILEQVRERVGRRLAEGP